MYNKLNNIFNDVNSLNTSDGHVWFIMNVKKLLLMLN